MMIYAVCCGAKEYHKLFCWLLDFILRASDTAIHGHQSKSSEEVAGKALGNHGLRKLVIHPDMMHDA